MDFALRPAVKEVSANTSIKDRVAPAIEAAGKLGPDTKDKFDAKDLLHHEWGVK